MPALEAAVLIPAYQPGPELLQLVNRLSLIGFENIVVVDDGSGPAYQQYFDEISVVEGVRVLRHAINLGKGAALKTGINLVLCDSPDIPALVTADADGQHHPEDVLAIARYAIDHPLSLVLGVRSFAAGVPLRSRVGNSLTRFAMRVVIGQKLTDTQTGLRSIPRPLRESLLTLPHQRYEFELDMLLECRNKRIPIAEVPIRTIYLEGNQSSHFRPLRDSMRIYFVLLRFAAVSLLTSLIDNLVFSAMFFTTGNLALSQITGRIVAMLFNFKVVTKVVFKTDGNRTRQFLEYIALVAFSGLVSYGLIRAAVTFLGTRVLVAKLCAESFLFFVNFLVQRDLIFSGRTEQTQGKS